MSDYLYFDQSFDLAGPTLSSGLPFALTDGKSQTSPQSVVADVRVPSYDSLYDRRLPLGPSFTSRLPYLNKNSVFRQSPDLHPPLLKPEKSKPDVGLYLARGSLPSYSVCAGDDLWDVARQRTPSAGFISPPLPLTPLPKYEAQALVNNEPSLHTGNKRKALLIGINYYNAAGRKPQLRGCVRDAYNMRQLLIQRFGYRPEDMILLSDEPSQTDYRLRPTRDNIIRAMQWLVHDARPGDSLVFQYAGHGDQVPDEDGDEEDKLDEVICPVDHEENGVIVDDQLHDYLVKPLPAGCRLTAIYDCCHSGTALDLPCTYTRDIERGILGSKNMYAMGTKTSPADVICWSACADCEQAADTKKTGVMSQAFISALNDGREHSFQSLFMAVDNAIRAIARPRFSQKPQLSGSHPIDITRKFTM